jgi:hypothetical protein
MRLLFSLIALIFMSTPVMASCYSAEEAEAEQAIRIHSELMVIGLNCQHMTPRGQQNFYSQYRAITNRHADLFSNYENTLVNYFSKNGGNAERKVHDLRTSFANRVSTDAANMRPDVFCSNYVRRLKQVNRMSRAELQQWAATAAMSEPLTQATCH